MSNDDLFAGRSEEETAKRAEQLAEAEDEGEVWSQLDFKPLDETPEDHDPVDFEALANEIGVVDRDYYWFKRDIQEVYLEREIGDLEEGHPDIEQAYIAFEERIVDDKAGHQFYLDNYAHIGEDELDAPQALEAFFAYQDEIDARQDAHKNMLDTQFKNADTEVVSGYKPRHAQERLIIRAEDEDPQIIMPRSDDE
jgi:hypothetical protein